VTQRRFPPGQFSLFRRGFRGGRFPQAIGCVQGTSAAAGLLVQAAGEL